MEAKDFGVQMCKDVQQWGKLLVNAVFMNHGTRQDKGLPLIFDTVAEMESFVFKRRFASNETLDMRSLSIEEQDLLKNIEIASYFYMCYVCSECAAEHMRNDVYSKFNDGFIPFLILHLVYIGLFSTPNKAHDALESYFNAVPRNPVPVALNFQKPASKDIFSIFVERAVCMTPSTLRYAFTRTTSGGINLNSVLLGNVSLGQMQIENGVKQYGWG